MLDSIKEYVQTHYSTKTAIFGGVVCAAAAIEMAILVPYNISQINKAAAGALEPLKYALSANLGGAIFYGLCALNIIPRTAAIGAGIFAFYSLINFQNEGTYLTSRMLGKTAEFISKEIVVPMCERILFPLIRRIVELSQQVISVIGKLIVKMPLPKHPVWVGVMIMAAAIIVYKLVIPFFSKEQQPVV